MKISRNQLKSLIEEVIQTIADEHSPKAIYMAGPPGSGKTSIIRRYLPSHYKIINSDDEYEKLMKDADITLRQIDLTPEQLSVVSSMQSKARNFVAQKLKTYLDKRENVIIDGTGGSTKTIEKQKKELEKHGYKTFMVMLYVSPMTSLKRNLKRGLNNKGRTLKPSIVIKTWYAVVKNISEYKNRIFKDSFSLITTEDDTATKTFSRKAAAEYFAMDKTAKISTMSPEEIQKKQAQNKVMYDEIEKMLKNPPEIDDVSTFRSKINKFLNN